MTDRTHCSHGHEYTVENTYQRPDGHGRQCRACITNSNNARALRLASRRIRTAPTQTDRAVIARLIQRFDRLQEEAGPREHVLAGMFSVEQLRLIEESLLGTLTAMNIGSHWWLTRIPEPTPIRHENAQQRAETA